MREEMNPPAIVREVVDLTSLGQRIRSGHEQCEGMAVNVGQWLTEAKEKCLQEGVPWTQWADAHTGIPESTRNRYVRQFKDSQGRTPLGASGSGQDSSLIRQADNNEPAEGERDVSKRKPGKAPRNVQNATEPEQAPEAAPVVPAPVPEAAGPRPGHCECGRAYPANVRSVARPVQASPPSTSRAAGLVKRIDLPKEQQCGKCQRTGLSSVCLNGCWKKALAWTEKNGH